MNANTKIQSLRNGGRVVLSEINGVRVVAERSGNGQTLRIVRETGSGFTVIKTEKF